MYKGQEEDGSVDTVGLRSGDGFVKEADVLGAYLLALGRVSDARIGNSFAL